MRLVDSRRLTGANLMMATPGAAIEVRMDAARSAAAVDAWRRHARYLLEELHWDPTAVAARTYRGGATLAIAAPIDTLYAACEVNEAAWSAACQELGGTPHAGSDLAALQALVEAEANPALLRLARAAENHDVTFLSDDDMASVGLGAGATRWPVAQLPAPEEVDWSAVHDVPTVLITGTNGKTTTVRMLAAIAAAAGRAAGNTSTDGVQIDGKMVLAGDYTGGEGARRLLRDPAVELALIEVARGGLLRRGLPVPRAGAALVTNVGHDHLGEYGIDDLEALARVKLLVSDAVPAPRPLLVNADDAVLATAARGLGRPVTWLGLEERGHELAYTLRDGTLGPLRSGRFVPWIAVEAVPAALGGAARHGVYNALAALALADSLGMPRSAVEAGLAGFDSDVTRNPGRGNLFDFGGLRAYADFAHNPEGVQRVVEMAAALHPERVLIILGQAGDRDDDAIDQLADAAWAGQPDRIVLKEMGRYLRGRAEGEVVARLRSRLQQLGAPAERLAEAGTELDAVTAALEWGREGDLLLLLLHERDEALPLLSRLHDRGWRPGRPLKESS